MKRILAAAALATGLGATPALADSLSFWVSSGPSYSTYSYIPAPSHTYNYVTPQYYGTHNPRAEVRRSQRIENRAEREYREARREYQHAVRHGERGRQLRDERRDLNAARHDLRHARNDLRHDRQDLRTHNAPVYKSYSYTYPAPVYNYGPSVGFSYGLTFR